MKKQLTFILLILAFAMPLFAQEQLTKRQQADKLFERYEYSKSLSLYLELQQQKKYDLTILEQIATCYREMNQYDEAEKWYSEVVGDEKAAPINSFYYAEVLLRNKNFEAAKNLYKKYYALTGNTAELAFKLATCVVLETTNGAVPVAILDIN